MELWTSPSDRPTPCGPCGQPVDNAPRRALTTACPHSRASPPTTPQDRQTNFFTCGLYHRNPCVRSSPIDWLEITQVTLDQRGFSPNHPVIAQTASDFNKPRHKTNFTLTFSLDSGPCRRRVGVGVRVARRAPRVARRDRRRPRWRGGIEPGPSRPDPRDDSALRGAHASAAARATGD